MLRKSYYLILGVILFGLILSGCSLNTDEDIAIKNDDSWKFTADLSIPQSDASLMQSGFSQMVTSEQNRVAGTSVKLTTEIKEIDQKSHYIFTFSGNGYADLNKVIEKGTIQRNGKQITIDMPFANAQDGRSTMTLHAGKIISSNATSVDGSTAKWDSVEASKKGITTIQATFEPQSAWYTFVNALGWLVLIVFIGLVCVAGFIFMGIKYGTLGEKLPALEALLNKKRRSTQTTIEA